MLREYQLWYSLIALLYEREDMEKKALLNLVRMELLSFVVFLLFLAGAYWDIKWMIWTAAVLFVAPVSGILRYRGRCKASGEPFDKARFGWAVISIFLYLGMGWYVLSLIA